MDSIIFSNIKQTLIDYYKKQDEFKDMNFAGSAINTLIDGMAYLGYYLTTYANFAINESFLDTAQKRSSVVSLSHNIGYMPAQGTSAKASVMVTYVGSSSMKDFIFPVGTTFQATKDGTTYYFRTYKTTPVNVTDAGKYWAQLDLREGTLIQQTFTQDPDSTTDFILDDNLIDLSTLTVRVFESDTDTIGIRFDELTDINQFSKKKNTDKLPCLYSVKENTDGRIELEFGDGVLSESVKPGNIVKVEYLSVSGKAANNIAEFTLTNIPGNPRSVSFWMVTPVEYSNSGTDRESIQSIRQNAPKFFQRQGRDVVADDYYSDIMANYSEIVDSLSVWGGEDNDPPDYGSVYICVKPIGALSLTSLQKQSIRNHILNSSVVGITPKLVDPTVVYVNMILNVEYKRINLQITKDELTESIKNTVLKYFNNNVSSFNVDFKYSKFLSSIFNVNDTILDITLDNTLYMYFMPLTTNATTYELNFKNAIEPKSVTIGPYYVYGSSSKMYYMTDANGDGILYEYRDTDIAEVGTVDYETGLVTINNYRFPTSAGEQIQISMKPASNNMKVTLDYIFSINSINVNLIADDAEETK